MTSHWDHSEAFLRTLTHVPGAVASADLLRGARARWEERVVARTSMSDLLFTRVGEEFPWSQVVRVAAEGDVFRFELRRRDLLVTADRATLANASAVLDAFLLQLAGDPDEA